MTTFDLLVLLVAGAWNEGVSLAPQVISQFRFFSRAVKP